MGERRGTNFPLSVSLGPGLHLPVKGLECVKGCTKKGKRTGLNLLGNFLSVSGLLL